MSDASDDQQETTPGNKLGATSRKQLRQKQQGVRLEEAMLLREVSVHDVATYCHKSDDTVRKWLTGNSPCHYLDELSVLLGVSPGWLAYGDRRDDWTSVPGDPEEQANRRALGLLEEVRRNGQDIRIAMGNGITLEYKKPNEPPGES